MKTTKCKVSYICFKNIKALNPIFFVFLILNSTSAQKKYLARGNISLSTTTGKFNIASLKTPFFNRGMINDIGTKYFSLFNVAERFATKVDLDDGESCNTPTFLNNPLIVLDANCAAKDGAISILPTTGIPPFLYSIDGGATYVAGPNTGLTFMNLAPGNYKLRLKGADGCESEIIERRIKMIYGGPKYSSNVEDETSCGNNNGSISIKPTSGVPPFKYSLDEGNTYVAGPDSGYTFRNVSAKTYFLRIKDSGECESEIVRSVVKYIYFPEARENTINASICAGEKYKLPWGSTVSTAGIYTNTEQYVGTTCDSLIRSVNLTVRPAATDTTVNVSILSGETYTFSPGRTTNSPGLYIDTIKYQGANCDSLIVKTNLTIRPRAIFTTTAASICAGSSYNLPSGKVVSLAGVYKDTIRYLKGGDSLIASVTLSVKTTVRINKTVFVCEGQNFILPSGCVLKNAGIYNDTLRCLSGCDSSITTVNFQIKPLPRPSIAKSNDIDCIVGSASLIASGGVKYTWQEAKSIINNSSQKIVVSPGVTTKYKVRVVGANGCDAEDSIEVKVIKQGQEGGYFVPSAFTPNNDGKNDCFGVRSWPNVTAFNFLIYNRWGEVVFQTSDPSICWDGTYKGRAQATEVFIYKISAKSFCGGQVDKKGTILLIR